MLNNHVLISLSQKDRSWQQMHASPAFDHQVVQKVAENHTRMGENTSSGQISILYVAYRYMVTGGRGINNNNNNNK